MGEGWSDFYATAIRLKPTDTRKKDYSMGAWVNGNTAGIRNYLNALYGGLTADGKGAMTPETGADLELMPTLGRSPLISEDELNYYVEEYSRHGLHAPCKCLPCYTRPYNYTRYL